jgi:hypothetical protein
MVGPIEELGPEAAEEAEQAEQEIGNAWTTLGNWLKNNTTGQTTLAVLTGVAANFITSAIKDIANLVPAGQQPPDAGQQPPDAGQQQQQPQQLSAGIWDASVQSATLNGSTDDGASQTVSSTTTKYDATAGTTTSDTTFTANGVQYEVITITNTATGETISVQVFQDGQQVDVPAPIVAGNLTYQINPDGSIQISMQGAPDSDPTTVNIDPSGEVDGSDGDAGFSVDPSTGLGTLDDDDDPC